MIAQERLSEVDRTLARRVAAYRGGYLPEERGLYPRMKVMDQLLFFAGLHGVTAERAKREAPTWASPPAAARSRSAGTWP